MRRSEGVLKMQSYAHTLLIILGIPFWIISLGCVYLGWVIAMGEIYPNLQMVLVLVIVSAFITGSTFAYNDYADRGLDKKNVRKKGSLLVRGLIGPKTVLLIAVTLGFFGLLLSILINLIFTLLMGTCMVLSLLYSNPHVRLKERGGWDLVVNMVGIGVVLPLAGWSVERPVVEFPFFYLPAIFLGIGTLYILSTVADYNVDKNMGIGSLVVRFGKERSISLGFIFLVMDSIYLWTLGVLNYLVEWNYMIYLCPPLAIQWFIYNHYMMRGKLTYLNIIKTIISLSTIFVAATGIFILFYTGYLKAP